MFFLHAPFVLFRFGFFYVMLISDIRNQHLVCIFLRPHRPAEFRPLEETVCGKQSAYCSAILHPHLMINLCFFLSFFCQFVLFLFAFFTLLCRFSPSFQIGKLSQKVREWHESFFLRQGGIRQETNAEVTLLPAITGECLHRNQWTLETCELINCPSLLINIVYWIEWQTNKKRSDLGDLCFIDSNESIIKWI